MGGKRHWLIVVDEFSDCSHSFFLKRKCDQIEMIPIWIKELKAKYGIDIKYIRLDNSGENRSLQTECDKQNLGKIFSFTAPGTPQQNSVVEITEVWILQGIYPLKDEWVFGCSLKTRLADQTKTQQLKWLWSKDSMNSTINLRVVEQTQETNFELEGSGGSTLVTP